MDDVTLRATDVVIDKGDRISPNHAIVSNVKRHSKVVGVVSAFVPNARVPRRGKTGYPSRPSPWDVYVRLFY